MRLKLDEIAPKLVLFGLTLAVVLPPFGPDRDLRGLAFLLAIFGGILQLLGLARRGLEPGRLRGYGALLGALFLAGAALVTPWTAEGLERLLLWTAALIGGAALAGDRAGRGAALRTVLVLAALLSLQALAERLYLFAGLREAMAEAGWSMAAELEPFFVSRRARASFGQANGLAAFLVLFLPFALRRALVREPARGAAAALAGALGAALWASGSRGGALAAATAIGLALALEPPGVLRRGGRIILGASLAGWLLVLAVYLGGEALVAREGPFRTLLLRRDYALQALEIGRRHAPFGCGLELFGEAQDDVVARSEGYSRFAHQIPLGLLAELGLAALPGLLLLAVLARGLVRSLRERSPSAPPPTGGPPLQLAPALAVAVLGGSLGFLVSRTWLDLALVLGLAAILDRWIVRPLVLSFDAADRRALAAGALGLLLHAQIDFDLRIASVTAAFALVTAPALLPGPEAGRRSFRSPVLILLLLAAAVVWVFLRPVDLQGLRRDLRQGATTPPEAGLELDALPESLRRLPGVARLREGLAGPR